MKVGLANQLEPTRFDEAVALGERIIESVETRPQLIEKLGVDPRFGFPDANWHPKEQNDFREGYNLLATLKWDEVKYLRFRAQNFNGFSLLHMAYGVGSSSEPIPVDYDTRLSEECLDDLVGRWRERITGLPLQFIFRPKAMLGEVGWQWFDASVTGVLINADTVAYQERMFLLYNGALLETPDKVLEIGGGYGALAYAITNGLPETEYWICDLPESLLFSGLYLTMTTNRDVKLWPERGSITLVPNYLFGQIKDKFDLFINTLSLAEMTEYQVRMYVQGIRDLMSPGAKFFEQNHLNNDLPDGTHQATVKQICAETFSGRTSLLHTPFEILNGPADVWST
jgi:hypothetical protein